MNIKTGVALLLLVASAHGQFVQGNVADTGSTATKTVTCAFPNPNAAGDTPLICVSWFAPTGTANLTDTLGNDYLPVSAPVVGAIASQEVFYCSNEQHFKLTKDNL